MHCQNGWSAIWENLPAITVLMSIFIGAMDVHGTPAVTAAICSSWVDTSSDTSTRRTLLIPPVFIISHTSRSPTSGSTEGEESQASRALQVAVLRKHG